jgi:eukaryotic-like serine/threonine-protein kinase
LTGTVLKHRYEVQEKIGEGSLFEVYRCDDRSTNRPAAVKVLLPHYASNRMFAERVLIEAQAFVGVEHPGLIEVYDSGEEDGRYYVITEYVRGVELGERVRRSAPMPVSTAVDMGIAIAETLDFVHRRNFVHGDLRPSSIMVTPEGQIKIGDFWVSAAIASSQTVRTGAMMRSIHYMSPEVAEGKPPMASADVYSLGVMLFEALTGRFPFDGETPIAIALKHAREPVPSVRSLNPSVPKELEAWVSKALQKAPQDRHRSARAMLYDLRSLRNKLRLPDSSTLPRPIEEKAVEASFEPDEVFDEPPEPPLMSAVHKTLLAIVVFIVVVVGAMFVYVSRRPPDVAIPNLVGKPIVEARAIAEEQELRLLVKSEQYNEDYPEGVVYFMNPPADKVVKAGRAVEVWVSKGSRFAITPDLVGRSLEEAKDAVSDAGLSVGSISEEYSDKVPAGNIIKQSPEPGARLERGQPVGLVYSLGAKPEESLPDDEAGPSLGEARSFDVRFTVPDGPEEQNVQIVVRDDAGESIVYSSPAKPGDRIEQTVSGVGDRVTISIYIDDRLVREERKWR